MIYIVNNHLEFEESGHEGIRKAIEAVSDEECECVHFLDLRLETIKELAPKAVILSGFPGHIGFRDMSQFATELEIIREINIPLLGLCGGHQLISLAYGSQVDYAKVPEEGMIEVEIVQEDPIFEGLSKKIIVRESHVDEVKSLPPHFILLATNRNCPIQGMRHREKLVYGFQFHPEYYTEEYPDGKVIWRNFMELVSESKSIEWNRER